MAHLHPSWGFKSKREQLTWNTNGNGSLLLTNPEANLTPPIATDANRKDPSCAWCGQGVVGENGVRGHVDEGGPQKLFCSDVCFSQHRRAAFKRAKVCDWCKHVRHTVTYVDLHDGRRQLQFCTDKCRNQYKMQLFCAEATSLGVQSCASSGLGGTTPGAPIDLNKTTHGLLITPDLWMTDSRADNPNNVKPECGDEGEACSNDSDQDEYAIATDTPLNLVHSSRENRCHAKKRPNYLPDIKEAPHVSSKKGKSHRKPNSLNLDKVTQQAQTSNSLHLLSQLPHHLAHNIWPAFPYPHHLPPHPYLLQSPLLGLNQSIKPLGNPISSQEDYHSPPTTSAEENTITKTKALENIEQNEKQEINSERAGQPLSKQAGNLPSEKLNLTQQLTLPPNFVVLRIPTLVPLPIPVPIPIPIHENYLKQVLNAT